METQERRRGAWWVGYAIPVVISLASLILSGVLWVNSTQSAQDVKIAVMEANNRNMAEMLSRIERDVAEIRKAVK